MSKMRPAKIALLDSGIGGVSILHGLLEALPGCAYYYYFDRAHFPYGTKSEEQVIDFVVEASQWLDANYQPDIIVVACNTASTVALPRLRTIFRQPIVGVVPAIKTAAQLTKTQHIALIATQATVNRNYVAQLVDDHARHCTLLKFPTQKLVAMAEKKMLGEAIALEDMRLELAPLFINSDQEKIDAVVLGCTHFSFLRDELAAISPWPIQWIDSVDAIARRVQYLIETSAQLCKVEANLTSAGEAGVAIDRLFITSSPLLPMEVSHLQLLLPEFRLMDRRE